VHGAEPAQPGQQPGIARRGRGELLHAEQPADPVQRSGHVSVRVRVDAAGDWACLIYDGQRHPFLWLRDGTHPLAVGPANPGL
jgi:hypothetical protein